MNLIHFNSLSPNQQTDIVWEWGFYITSLKDEKNTRAIFLLSDFLVEIIYVRADNSTLSIKGLKISKENEHFVSQNVFNNPLLKVLV